MADLLAPKPLYRSRLFWLGVPGLVFLLWAWGRSNFVWSFMLLESSRVSSSSGELTWFHSKIASTGCFPPQGFYASTGQLDLAERRWFPPPAWRAAKIDADSSYRSLAVPYWLLASGYVGAWLGICTGWRRRKFHSLKFAASPPP